MVSRAELRLLKPRKPRLWTKTDPRSVAHKNYFSRIELWDIGTEQLITYKYVRRTSFGWQSLEITEAVRRWVRSPDTNKGIWFTIIKNLRKSNRKTVIRFDREIHKNKKPLALVYLEQRRGFDTVNTSTMSYATPKDHLKKQNNDRLKRGVQRNGCHRLDLIVNIEKINYDKWIFQPKIFNIYRCVGDCGIYMPEDQTTSHATIQATIHELQPGKNINVKKPCCAPLKLDPLELMLYDTFTHPNGSTVPYYRKKRYENMVVKTCACL